MGVLARTRRERMTSGP
jgi:hypothetical protein